MKCLVNQVDDHYPIYPKNLFVYGSFMEGFFNYEKTLKGRVISNTLGKVKGILYHQKLKGYPAIIPGDGWVSGEFLELENFDEQIKECDRIENYFGPNHPDNEYDRRVSKIKFADENTSSTWAWIYWYARNDLKSDKNPVIYIPSGDWRDFMHKIDDT